MTMASNENNDTPEDPKRWRLLWSCFEQLIETDAKQQAELLEQLQQQHPSLFPELAQLLASHQTDSTVLDQSIHEQTLNTDFAPPDTIGDYKILEPLGSGGLGDVYLASRLEDDINHKVAIKFASAGRFAPMVLQSFNNELKALLNLNHPHIERLYEGGITTDNIPYLVVEYIEGVHIDQYCDQHRLKLKQRIELFLQVCDAVSAMHQSLIIHRDIKASNIMVNQQGQCKLLDFGLAKLTAQNPTEKQQTVSGFLMTLAYASPEQIKGQPINTTSDVYSLGMLLHLLLTGQLPYRIKEQDLADASEKITQFNPPAASLNLAADAVITQTHPQLKKRLQGELDAILAKAIDKDPERRYASAAQFAEDLHRYLNQHPIMAKKDTVFYRASKFVQRHTVGVLTTVAVMASLLVLSVLLFNRSQDLQQALVATQEEQQRVRQVTDFLIDIFKLSDPIKNQSDIVNVKDLLDYASLQLDQQFDQQPETKAKLYETLGTVYLNMSDMEAAGANLDKAMKMQATNNTEDRLSVLLTQAEWLQKKGQLNDALALLAPFDDALENHSLPEMIGLRLALIKGQLLYQSNQLSAASELLTTASQRIMAQEHPTAELKSEQLLADINQLLGNVYWRKGQLDAVGKHYQQAYDSNLQRLGAAHHLTLRSLSALGVLDYSQGRFEAAQSQFKQVLQFRLEQLGPNHYLTGDAHNRLGATYYELGHLDQAEHHYQAALTAFESSDLTASIKFTRVLNNLGLIKRQQQQYQSAQNLFQQALAIQTELLGQQHPDLAALLNNLGLTAYDLGQFRTALGWFQQAYQIQLDALGTDNVKIAFAMTNMGRMYLALGHPDQAIHWIEQALQLRASQTGTDHLLYAASLMAKAEWAYSAKNLETAAKSAKDALNIRKKHIPESDWRMADSRLLWHSTQTDKAAFAQQMACDAALIERQFGADHPRALAAYQRLQGLSLPVCQQSH